MKAFISVLIVALVSQSNVCGSKGGRKQVSDVTRLLADVEQHQSNVQYRDILTQVASGQKMLALKENMKSAIAQIFEEAQAQGAYINENLLDQVIDDGERHSIPHSPCKFSYLKKHQLEKQIKPVKLNGIEYVILYYIVYAHHLESTIMYISEAKLADIKQNYIAYVNREASYSGYRHPEDPDFIHELSEKLREIQPDFGEAISTRPMYRQNDYVLTESEKRNDVIHYLLSCVPPPPVYYVKYSKPRPIDNAILDEIKSDRYRNPSLVGNPRFDRFRIEHCNIPKKSIQGVVTKIAYKVQQWTGLQYVALLFMYSKRDREVENNVMSDLLLRYAEYVRLHHDHHYTNPVGVPKTIKSKLQYLAPTLKIFDGFQVDEHSNKVTLMVPPDSFEDKVLRYILYCHTPPNDFSQ